MGRQFRTFFAVAFAAAALLALAPVSASASVISDCTADNSLDGKYSTSELRDALKNMPADVDQYYGCSDLIRQALLKDVDKHPKRGGDSAGDSNAALNAATTSAQRKQAERKAEKAVEKAVPGSGATSGTRDGAGEPTGAKSLGSSASPGTPGALLIALAGLFLLFLGDLAARGAKLPAVKKFMRRSGPTDGSR